MRKRAPLDANMDSEWSWSYRCEFFMCEGVLMHQAMAATTQPSALAAGSSLPKNDLSRFVSTQTHQELPRLILFLKKLAHLVTYLGPCLSVSFRVFRLTHSSLGHFFLSFFCGSRCKCQKKYGSFACVSFRVFACLPPSLFWGRGLDSFWSSRRPQP